MAIQPVRHPADGDQRQAQYPGTNMQGRRRACRREKRVEQQTEGNAGEANRQGIEPYGDIAACQPQAQPRHPAIESRERVEVRT
jgi:hypothetical protein